MMNFGELSNTHDGRNTIKFKEKNYKMNVVAIQIQIQIPMKKKYTWLEDDTPIRRVAAKKKQHTRNTRKKIVTLRQSSSRAHLCI